MPFGFPNEPRQSEMRRSDFRMSRARVKCAVRIFECVVRNGATHFFCAVVKCGAIVYNAKYEACFFCDVL